MNGTLHGGRLDEAVEKYGGDKSRWLDLSTGINANGWPVPELDSTVWARLPDEVAHQRCINAVRSALNCPNDAHISLAGGSQAHIQALPHFFKPQPVAVIGFSYQEHAICWQRAGHEVYVTDGLESAEATARIVVVVNPNNPDGRIFDREDLISLSRRLAAKGGLLVVDEAFGDVAPRASLADQAGREGLIVLRSIGKFFGLAGVRLGMALTTPTLGMRLDERHGPWAVSGPALAVGAAALEDEKWQKRALKKLVTGRENLEEILLANGMSVVGGTPLFVLAQQAKSDALAQHLAKKRILVRAFSGKPEWLRFGVPANRAGLTRLSKALASFGPDAL